jgi:hypothetical protein
MLRLTKAEFLNSVISRFACLSAEQWLHSRLPSPPKEDKMAKGQVRSNRETRKPKKDKTAAVTAAPAGAQVKLAGSGLISGKKPK